MPRSWQRHEVRLASARFHRQEVLHYNSTHVLAPPRPSAQQSAPAASGARLLLLPRRIVSGERAALAVLDVNGRLTPGVTVNFSNGDRLTTDATGRALFVAPLNPGVIYGSIAGRSGRVATAILAPGEAYPLRSKSHPRRNSLRKSRNFSVAIRCAPQAAEARRILLGLISWGGRTAAF